MALYAYFKHFNDKLHTHRSKTTLETILHIKKQHIENKFSGVFFTCSIKLPFITKQTTQDKPISKRICNLATFSASVDVAFWVRYAPFFIRMRIGLCIGLRIGLYIVLRTTQERKKVAKRIRNQSRIIPKKPTKTYNGGPL